MNRNIDLDRLFNINQRYNIIVPINSNCQYNFDLIPSHRGTRLDIYRIIIEVYNTNSIISNDDNLYIRITGDRDRGCKAVIDHDVIRQFPENFTNALFRLIRLYIFDEFPYNGYYYKTALVSFFIEFLNNISVMPNNYIQHLKDELNYYIQDRERDDVRNSLYNTKFPGFNELGEYRTPITNLPVITEFPGLDEYFNYPDNKNVEADIKAEKLFYSTFPEYKGQPTSDNPIYIKSKISKKINYLFYGFGMITVVENLTPELGKLCMNIDLPKGKYYALSKFDRIMQKILLLKKDEINFWKESFFHGRKNKELDELFPVKYFGKQQF